MIQTPTLLVLAAGMGSRYGGLKQLDSMGPHGETILDYSVHDAIRAGFGRIVFVIRRDLEGAFRETIGNRYADRIPIEYVFQELDDLPEGHSVPKGRQKPWGTGHALLAARNTVSGAFAVINADDFYGADAFAVLDNYFSTCLAQGKTPLCLVAYQLSHTLSSHGTVNRGICSVSEGRLRGVEEFTSISMDGSRRIHGTGADRQSHDLAGDSLASMNFWGFHSDVFPVLMNRFKRFFDQFGADPKSEFYIPSFVDDLIQNDGYSCDVLRTSGEWFGVTFPGDRESVQERLLALTDEGKYPRSLL